MQSNAQNPAPNSEDEFWARVGHELRSPLTTVLAQAEALTSGVFGPLPEQQQHAVKSIIESTRHALSMIHDVVSIASGSMLEGSVSSKGSNLGNIVQEAIQRVAQLAGQRAINLSVATSPPDHQAHESQIAVIQRLLSEVIGHMLLVTRTKSELTLRAEVSETEVVFDITNTTAPSGDLQEQPPCLTEDARTSALLDLPRRIKPIEHAVLKRLLDDCQGSWTVQNLAGKAVAMNVRIPIAKPSADPSPAVTAHTDQRPASGHAPTKSSSPRPVILLADDQADLVMITSHYLESLGYDIKSARDGREAVELAAQCQPDLILMDVQMPVMDGITATQIIRDSSSRTPPVICLTGMSTEAEKKRCLDAGAVACLHKPFGTRELQSVIDQFVGKPATVPDRS